jgi:hypothetical protein
LCIPSLGDTFTLAEDWTFSAVNDHRNVTVIRWAQGTPSPLSGPQDWFPLGYPYGKNSYAETQAIKNRTISVLLPKGTILKIDRIYIRKGAKEFDSVTFFSPNTKVKINKNDSYSENKSLRFFASLSDVNQMRVE